MIDFARGDGFASVSDVLAALRQEGSAGTVLQLPHGGEIHFADLSQSALRAANFRIDTV
jgi:hypothetical protein